MPTKKPRKPSPNEAAYAKELRRLQNFIRRAQKRGYSFANYSLPKKPKKVTKKSVEKLKAITPKELYAKSTYYDIVTDSRVSGTEAQKLIRSRAAKKSAQTRYARHTQSTKTEAGQPPNDVDDVLVYVYELIANWKPLPNWTPSFATIKERDKNTMKRMLDGAVENLGRRTAAKNCQARASDVKDLAWLICYGYSGEKKDTDYLADLAALTAIVYGRNLTVKEAKDFQERYESYGYENEEE